MNSFKLKSESAQERCQTEAEARRYLFHVYAAAAATGFPRFLQGAETTR